MPAPANSQERGSDIELAANGLGVSLCSHDEDRFLTQQTLGRVLRDVADEGRVVPAVKVDDVVTSLGMVQQVGPG